MQPNVNSAVDVDMDMDMNVDADAVDLVRLHHSVTRRSKCVSAHLPKLALLAYLAWAVVATFLCLTAFRPSIEHLSVVRSPSPSSQFTSLALDHSESAQFSVQACDVSCSNSQGTWCCNSGDTCSSRTYYCDTITIAVGLIITIVLLIWFGPLIIYLIIISIVRCSQAGRFQTLANSGRYQSWVVVSGCFQMSLNESSGDADFNQAAYSLVNTYGGCGDECVMHCIGVWFCSTCYPCCMCCVSAARNQSKVGSLQGALSLRGYNTNVQFLSSIIPACCNSIFIGLVSKGQPAGVVMIAATPATTVVYSQPMVYQTGAPVQYQTGGAPYAQPVQYVQAQPQYAPQYAPQGSYPPPQYAQPQPIVPGVSYSQPPDVVKSQPPEVAKPAV